MTTTFIILCTSTGNGQVSDDANKKKHFYRDRKKIIIN